MNTIRKIELAKEWVRDSDSDANAGHYEYGFRVHFMVGEGQSLFYPANGVKELYEVMKGEE